jgi:hypothetical protein
VSQSAHSFALRDNEGVKEEAMINQTAASALVILVCAATPAISDTKVVTEYTTDGQTVETTIYAKGGRLRYEYGDGLTLIRKCDQKRIIQIDDKSKTYLSLPVEEPAAAPSRAQVNDTGERKPMLGHSARHLKIIDAAEGNKGRTETDGWYVDMADLACSSQDASGTNHGFPVTYATTNYGEDGKVSSTVTMRLKGIETDPLEPALFEIPAGYTESGPHAAGQKASQKAPGMIRIGAVMMRDKSNRQAQSDGAYQRLIAQLQEAQFDVVPLADGSPEAITQKARDWQCDYVLYNELGGAEKPPATGGKIGGFLRHAPVISHVTGGEAVEARLDYRLVPVGGGSPVLVSSVTGKTGGTFNWKAAASLASNVIPMAMAAKMIGGSGMLNPVMMHALMGGHGVGASMSTMDPMMSGMSMFLRSANPAFGMAANMGQNPAAADGAMAAAADQEAKAIIAQLKPASK